MTATNRRGEAMTEVTTAQLTGGLAAILVIALAVVGMGTVRAELKATAAPSTTAAERTSPVAPPPVALDGALPSVPEEPTTYRVAAGDTLSQIAAAIGVPVEVLLEANELDGPEQLAPGQELRIPPLAAAAER